jgi:hypothetical protein
MNLTFLLRLLLSLVAVVAILGEFISSMIMGIVSFVPNFDSFIACSRIAWQARPREQRFRVVRFTKFVCCEALTSRERECRRPSQQRRS